MRELAALVSALDGDEGVRTIVFYGGSGRSFSVGGDFHETSEFEGGIEVADWIDDVVNLYVACLSTTTPIVAAIDGYAIGIGLQIALTADYRLGARESVLKMPEFEVGIACNLGGFMLTEVVGRSVMQAMLFSCAPWTATKSTSDGLLHQVVSSDALLKEALSRAHSIASYAAEPLRATKPHLNANFVEGLETIRSAAKQSHRRGFSAGAAQHNMRRIIHAD